MIHYFSTLFFYSFSTDNVNGTLISIDDRGTDVEDGFGVSVVVHDDVDTGDSLVTSANAGGENSGTLTRKFARDIVIDDGDK